MLLNHLAKMDMAICFMVIDAQDVLAMRKFAFPASM
jgi:hypothetical protein